MHIFHIKWSEDYSLYLPNSYPTNSSHNDDFLVKGVSGKTHIYLKLKITFGKGYDKKFWLS